MLSKALKRWIKYSSQDDMYAQAQILLLLLLLLQVVIMVMELRTATITSDTWAEGGFCTAQLKT